MFLKLSLFIGFIVFSQIANSQSNPWLPPFEMNYDDDLLPPINTNSLTCTNSSVDYSEYYNRFDMYRDNFEKHPEITILINFNIWQKDDGTENWNNDPQSIARLYQIVDWINQHYQNNISPSDPIPGVVEYPTTKIRFELNQIYFYQNTTLWGSNGGVLQTTAFNQNPTSKNQLNIHITGGSYGTASGFTFPPSTNMNQDMYIVTFNNEALLEGDWVFAGHLSHELGHDLDLLHTYTGVGGGAAICDQTNANYLFDVHGTGTNSICPHQAGWSCDPFASGNTCTNNMMGGTPPGFYFSPMQIQQMHRALALKAIRKYVKCEYYDNETYVDIMSNEEWDFNIKFYNSIRIKSGNTLTVKCKIIMSPGLKIIIEPGARLILDGGIITTECDEFWKGIEVLGNSGLIQNSLNQGHLIVRNNAIIEFAENAIFFGKEGEPNKGGGLVHASNSTFRNNLNCVKYLPYNYYSPTTGNEILNKGRFLNCEFLWDDNLIGTVAHSAFDMNHINGVIITGCTIRDDRTTVINAHDRPYGVISLDAGYKITGRNIGPLNSPIHHTYSETNYDVSYFKNLREGVYAMNALSQNSITVDHTKFEDMIYGIHLSSVDNAILTRNKFDFTFSRPSDITVMHEMALSKSTGFTVEGNIFNKQPATSFVEGALVYNSGFAANRIYRNTYENLYTANYANGENTNDLSGLFQPSGLQFLCNNYSFSKKHDEYVYTFPNGNGNGQGIRLKQGTSSEPAGNTFSLMNPGQGKAHIKSTDFDNIIYYAFNTPPQIPSVLDGGIGTQYTLSQNVCQSTFNGYISPNGGVLVNSTTQLQMLSDLQTIDVTYSQKANELSLLLASGDTQYLHDLVANLSNSNKQVVRNGLLNASPYLSETLLIELGEKTPNVFPPSWYKSIIEANVEIAQNKSFIYYLNNKPDPLAPGLVNNIIEYGLTHSTVRGTKMDELTDLNTEKAVNLNYLISNEISDSSEVNWTAYKEFIIQRDDIICRSQLADMYLGKGETMLCDSKLDDIDVHINEYMIDEVKQEMIDYSTFKKYILGIIDSSSLILNLTLDQIELLSYVADNFRGKSSVQAKNLLCYLTGQCEDLIVEYANNNKSAEVDAFVDMYNSEISLGINPNPNNGQFEVKVPNECSILNVYVNDIQGRKVEFELESIASNIAKVEINDASSGIYLMTIECEGKTYTSRVVIR
jgi:hypothetical protein